MQSLWLKSYAVYYSHFMRVSASCQYVEHLTFACKKGMKNHASYVCCENGSYFCMYVRILNLNHIAITILIIVIKY